MELKIKDIAKKAGVSPTAVSFALNGKEGISEKTRQKILQIVEEEGYTSKSLMKKRLTSMDMNESSRLIFLLYPVNAQEQGEGSEDSYSFYEIMQKVEKQIREFKYNLFFKSIPMQGNYKKEIEKMIDFYQVEGMIVVGTQMSPAQIKNIYSITTPMVVIDRFFQELNVDCVAFDNFAGAYEAVTYLIENHHRKIGYVGTGSTNINLAERREGYEAAMRDMKGLTDPRYCISDIKNSEKEKWIELLGMPKEMPTAFLVESDYLAIDVIKELQAAGFLVPQQISVIGFDNSVIANLVTPELTTMNLPWDKLARLSVLRLMEKMRNGADGALKSKVSTELVERKSCRRISKDF